jgi:hypothetical protein
MKSEFVMSPTSKAFSFGIAREAYSKVYIKEHPPKDPSVPGPGQYPIQSVVGNDGSKYTMRPKTVSSCKFAFLCVGATTLFVLCRVLEY